MRVAFWFDSDFGQKLVDGYGNIVGDNSGLHLLRRLMALWPDPILIGDEDRQCRGFELKKLDHIDQKTTLVVSMAPLSTPELYRRMKKSVFQYPKLMNFVWFNVSEYPDEKSRQLLAWSCAQFPTMCNSARTAREIREIGARYVSSSMMRNAYRQFAPLGVDLERIVARKPVGEKIPTVWYPAMWMFDRKDPGRFEKLLLAEQERVPLEVRANLNAKHLEHEVAQRWRSFGWDVREARPRAEYYEWLPEPLAFVATAKDESYGLNYLEGMLAGQIGLFLNKPWVKEIVPPDYPFVADSMAQAGPMLHFILTHPVDAQEMVASVPTWIREHHDSARFDRVFKYEAEWVFDQESGGRGDG